MYYLSISWPGIPMHAKLAQIPPFAFNHVSKSESSRLRNCDNSQITDILGDEQMMTSGIEQSSWTQKQPMVRFPVIYLAVWIAKTSTILSGEGVQW